MRQHVVMGNSNATAKPDAMGLREHVLKVMLLHHQCSSQWRLDQQAPT